MANNDDGDAFNDKLKTNGSGKRDIHFNRGAKDGRQHGHVTQSEDAEGNRKYHYVRDRDGKVAVDDNPKSTTYTGG
jgi:hypothetical protein